MKPLSSLQELTIVITGLAIMIAGLGIALGWF